MMLEICIDLMAVDPLAILRHARASEVLLLALAWTWKKQPALPYASGNVPPNPKFYQPPHLAAT